MAENRSYSSPTANSGTGLILLAIVFLIGIMALALLDLPFTKHAETSHQEQSINAASLVTMIEAGLCHNLEVYDCPDNATIVILCKIKNNVVGGLVLGINLDGTKHIITGYPARPSYWRNNVSGCRYMGGTFALP